MLDNELLGNIAEYSDKYSKNIVRQDIELSKAYTDLVIASLRIKVLQLAKELKIEVQL